MTGQPNPAASGPHETEQLHFGQYLVDAGAVTSTQLHDALAKQLDLNVRLGVVAMDRGLLTHEQVQTILTEQAQSQDVFGLCAVRLGLLHPQQMDGLLTDQKAHRLRVGQLLVIGGVLTVVELEQHLEGYTELQP